MSMQSLIQKSQAFTLLGMSGVGKTTLANKLPRERWFHYSGDYRIGTRYLGEAIHDDLYLAAMALPRLAELLLSDSIYIRSNISMNNLAPLSAWIGTLGDATHGGHPAPCGFISWYLVEVEVEWLHVELAARRGN